MNTSLPPGPRMPILLQSIGNWKRPTAFVERQRRRFGKRFTLRMIGLPPMVMLSDPDDIKELFLSAPELVHPGEGARILEPIVGRNSVILLDEAPHLEQRRLLLPAFHGERMQSLAGLMEELTERELDSWPQDQVTELHPRLQQLTLEIILRAVFGLERGARLENLRRVLTEILAFAESPLSLLPPLPAPLDRFGPTARVARLTTEVDELIFGLIEERRGSGEEEPSAGEDVLALLLSARHEDDSPMSDQEIRDELMTALVAGHETTASQLAWAFERLSRERRVLERLTDELDAGADEDYLTATINEIMRLQPVLPHAEPRLTKAPVTIGGVEYPAGVLLMANVWLVHHDADIYPEPYALRPERFLDQAPGTYTWLPFGGGRRRCLGASFAQLEMRIVLRAVLRRMELSPAGSRPETVRRRSITYSPSAGCSLILTARRTAGARGAPEQAVLAGAA